VAGIQEVAVLSDVFRKVEFRPAPASTLLCFQWNGVPLTDAMPLLNELKHSITGK
jgi:hypothetical protein